MHLASNHESMLAEMSRDLDEIRELESPLILYVGPQLSRLAGLPTEAELIASLMREAEDYLSVRQHRELSSLAEGDSSANYPDIYSELERALSPASFGRVVERILDDEESELPELAQAIAGLEPRLRGVITPNLDLLLERAFAGQLVSYPKPSPDLAARNGWLLKLRGTLHDRSSWILTTEQRGQALHRDPLHRDLFRSLFLSHPILFVGTRLDEGFLDEMVDELRGLVQGQPPEHWALVNEEEIGPITRRKFAAVGIRLIGYEDPEDTHAGCISMLRELSGEAPKPASASAPAPAATAPPAAAPAPATPAAEPAPAPEPAAAAPAVAPAPAPAAAAAPIHVLFIAANPSGTDPLRIDRELRIIREAIDRSRNRNSLELDIRTAATVHDLRRAMLERDYQIVHLSGHGEQEGLLLENDAGECVEVPRAALARFFSRCAERSGLRCVLLNACWSGSIADDAGMSVPFTVAMDGPISDVAALEYSRGFYDAVGAGMDMEAAHDEGMMCVDLAAPGAKFDCRLVRD